MNLSKQLADLLMRGYVNGPNYQGIDGNEFTYFATKVNRLDLMNFYFR